MTFDKIVHNLFVQEVCDQNGNFLVKLCRGIGADSDLIFSMVITTSELEALKKFATGIQEIGSNDHEIFNKAVIAWLNAANSLRPAPVDNQLVLERDGYKVSLEKEVEISSALYDALSTAKELLKQAANWIVGTDRSEEEASQWAEKAINFLKETDGGDSGTGVIGAGSGDAGDAKENAERSES